MEGLLTPVSTTYLRVTKDEAPEHHDLGLVQVRQSGTAPPAPDFHNIDSADKALEALRSQPDYETLISVLKFLSRSSQGPQVFAIHAPGPKSAALVQLLVTETAPNYWILLSESPEDRFLFISCLRSISGINAILSHVRVLIQESKAAKPENPLFLGISVDLLAAVLQGDDALRTIWVSSVAKLPNETQKKAQSQALLALLSSGKLVSWAGEALDILGKDQASEAARWVGDGAQMSKYIASSISLWAKSAQDQVQHQFCASLFQRSLSLGYSGMHILIFEDHPSLRFSNILT
jgi:telomere length regulation protein